MILEACGVFLVWEISRLVGILGTSAAVYRGISNDLIALHCFATSIYIWGRHWKPI